MSRIVRPERLAPEKISAAASARNQTTSAAVWRSFMTPDARSNGEVAHRRMAAKVAQRTARDCTSRLGAHAAEARPIVEVDDRETVGLEDRIAAPDFQAQRRRRNRGRMIERARLRVAKMSAALRNRRKVFAAAHAVELDDLADHFLLNE